MFSKGEPTDVIGKIGTNTVTRSSFKTLKNCRWVNDEVIHFYMELLARRDEFLSFQNVDKKQSHFFKSFFLSKILNEGATFDGSYSYGNVKRWGKQVHRQDVFQLDKIFFPVNQKNRHWALVVVYMENKIIQAYDSIGGRCKRELETIFRFLKDEHKHRKGSDLPNQNEWQLVSTTQDTPMQQNGYDCGVFVCMFANLISMNQPLVIRQGQMEVCRKRIALAIITKKSLLKKKG